MIAHIIELEKINDISLLVVHNLDHRNNQCRFLHHHFQHLHLASSSVGNHFSTAE